jgi:ribokinase
MWGEFHPTMSKNSILVIGSSNTDLIIKMERIPRSGETVLGGEFARAAGGKGANQAVGAARAGGAVTFIGRVGRDNFGESAVAGLAADGINVEHVARDEHHPSGVAFIFVGKQGENSIAVASGANGSLSPADVRKAAKVFAEAAVALVQLEVPLKTVIAAAKLARASGARVILNPAPAQPLPASLLKLVDIITPNETEAEMLTGIPVNDEAGAARAARKLRASGVKHVIITMGVRGAFVSTAAIEQVVPSHKMKAVDTTAAGDIFNGTLAVALAEGKALLDAVRFASAAAAISVTRLGAQTSAPSRKEIDRLLLNGKVARGRAGFNHDGHNGGNLAGRPLGKRNGAWAGLDDASRICSKLPGDNG